LPPEQARVHAKQHGVTANAKFEVAKSSIAIFAASTDHLPPRSAYGPD